MAFVVCVSKKPEHSFSKVPVAAIQLIAGEGVAGDAHRGVTVKHRSRVKADPSQPNLRQVHLIQFELIQELQTKGFRVGPASMGENITTCGLDLLALPKGALLQIGETAMVQVTGLLNPCVQLERFQSGLMSAVLDQDASGNLIRKAGIMSIVTQGGQIRVGDKIEVIMPEPPYEKLDRV